MGNGKNGDLLNNKRRLSAVGGGAQSYGGPGDLEAAAREYNSAFVYTDTTALDANTAVDRIIEDSWNGEVGVILFTDTLNTVAPTRREVPAFGGFLRVRHVVYATSGGAQVGASFGSGITDKQT
jgi:hypothetical protein